MKHNDRKVQTHIVSCQVIHITDLHRKNIYYTYCNKKKERNKESQEILARAFRDSTFTTNDTANEINPKKIKMKFQRT